MSAPTPEYGWNEKTCAALKRRIHAQTSQAKLARLAGMSPSNLSHLLSFKQEPGVSKLVAVALALGTTLDPILSADETPRLISVNDRLRDAQVLQAIASAEGMSMAIDCLPVGKDIRNRLQAHVQAHIDLLRRCAGDAA